MYDLILQTRCMINCLWLMMSSKLIIFDAALEAPGFSFPLVVNGYLLHFCGTFLLTYDANGPFDFILYNLLPVFTFYLSLIHL